MGRRMSLDNEVISPLVEPSPEGVGQNEEDNGFKPRQKQGDKKRTYKATAANVELALNAKSFNTLGVQSPLNSANVQASACQLRDFLESDIEVS